MKRYEKVKLADIKPYERNAKVHFLFESGLDNETWARDESIIDWMALQFHKIGKVIAQCVD